MLGVERMKKLNLEQRINKIALSIGLISKKILKKEFKKLKKDMIKGAIKNG